MAPTPIEIVISIFVFIIFLLIIKWFFSPRRDRYVPEEVKQKVLERYWYMCAFCTETNLLSLHHREGYAEGGEQTEKNLVPLCPYHHELVTRYPKKK